MEYIPIENRYESMIYRRCGNSGLQLPTISLGLWHNFGDVDSYENYRKIIWKAFDSGITHFDLANNYGPPAGSAEKNFGKILSSDLKDYRDELIISTKAGYYMWPGPYGEWGSRKYLLASLDQSLKRMSIDYVDIFYTHRFDPKTPLDETMGALSHAVKMGKALYVGISNYPAKETAEAAKLLKNMGTPCLIHQPKYSMLNRWAEEGLLNTLEDEGIGCIAFSPLAQGLLTSKYIHGIPENSRARKPHGFLQESEVTPQLVQKISKLNEVALNRRQTLAQMSISWLLKDSRVTSVLVGASSAAQLAENIQSVSNLSFHQEELDAIERILKM
ncbi:MAG TPA: L-glyceraldehyde 3-phosphate reductase [Tenuifilaceae bacterium]|nr:L-glyceraldehyde 3-phosphate reductase [Tenuifilaceae bacterium]HPJ45451.1 L-glyceraldehyde 3-phosphate reductase [Tenuifilaceae bacterium]HPQ34068.1 L-glyceraldehyde 3-phosphate reductase [Tenuifilaceae bacterium]HRX68037.1 L-glyceraldehyde 3-phosphate reductase [Tenuifilaceae bacterium]